MTRTKLTKTQRDILLHRLSVPDCIGEVVGEIVACERCGDDYDHPDFAEICETIGNDAFDAANRMHDHFADGGELSTLPDLSDIERLVLFDVIDGSVWYGSMIGNVPNSLLSRHYRIGCELATIVSDLIGRKVEFPDH